MHLSTGLRALARPDLQLLLRRRPEAALLAGQASPSYGALAGLLSRPSGIELAVAELNRFQRQVLELACLRDGRLSLEAAGAEGLGPDLLDAAARDLQRWGLAFREDDGLSAPRAVVEAIRNPGGLGRPLAQLLELQTVQVLTAIAERLGAPTGLRRKADLQSVIARRLSGPALARDLLAVAPPPTREALEAIRRRGGEAGQEQLLEDLPAGTARQWSPYSRGGADEGGVPWLIARGLAYCVEWPPRLVVPREVELALRGRVFPEWEFEPPELDLSAFPDDSRAMEAVAALDWLLDFWGAQRPALLKSGGLGLREMRRSAAAAGIAESEAWLLYRLAARLGLIVAVEQEDDRHAGARSKYVAPTWSHRLRPSGECAKWFRRPVAERWVEMFDAWRDGAGWAVSGEPPWPVMDTAGAIPTVLSALLELPDGQAATVESFAGLVSWRWPVRFRPGETTAGLVRAIAQEAAFLGAGAAPPRIGLGRIGRLAAGADASPDLDAIARLMPAPVEEITIQADLRIVVAGPPATALARELASFADLESAHPARVYRLSEASLRRALDEGDTAGQILRQLSARARTAVPQNVAALIEDVGRRHGRLRVSQASFVVQADDPALIAEVVSSKRLRAHQPRLLAPTVAAFQARSLSELLGALRGAGFMPAAEMTPPQTGRTQLRSADRVQPLARRNSARRSPAGLDESRSAALAEALIGTPDTGLDVPSHAGLSDEELLSGVMVTDQADLGRLFGLAASAGVCVEIEYGNQTSGRITQRVVEPLVADQDIFMAWCRLRQGERTFATRGVHWARATQERFNASSDARLEFDGDSVAVVEVDDGRGRIVELFPGRRRPGRRA